MRIVLLAARQRVEFLACSPVTVYNACAQVHTRPGNNPVLAAAGEDALRLQNVRAPLLSHGSTTTYCGPCKTSDRSGHFKGFIHRKIMNLTATTNL